MHWLMLDVGILLYTLLTLLPNLNIYEPTLNIAASVLCPESARILVMSHALITPSPFNPQPGVRGQLLQGLHAGAERAGQPGSA